MRCVCLPCAVYFQSSTHAPAQKGLLALQVDWLVREAQLIPPSGVLHRPGRSDRGAEVLLVMDEVWHAPFPWALLDAAARAAAADARPCALMLTVVAATEEVAHAVRAAVPVRGDMSTEVQRVAVCTAHPGEVRWDKAPTHPHTTHLPHAHIAHASRALLACIVR